MFKMQQFRTSVKRCRSFIVPIQIKLWGWDAQVKASRSEGDLSQKLASKKLELTTTHLTARLGIASES